MTTCKDIMKRIQKYDGIHLFLVLDKNGKKLNDDLEEEERKITQNTFNNNYADIPKLVDKAISCVRDIDPLNELTFLQILEFFSQVLQFLYFVLQFLFLD